MAVNCLYAAVIVMTSSVRAKKVTSLREAGSSARMRWRRTR